jgi:hypothetical protein
MRYGVKADKGGVERQIPVDPFRSNVFDDQEKSNEH